MTGIQFSLRHSHVFGNQPLRSKGVVMIYHYGVFCDIAVTLVMILYSNLHSVLCFCVWFSVCVCVCFLPPCLSPPVLFTCTHVSFPTCFLIPSKASGLSTTCKRCFKSLKTFFFFFLKLTPNREMFRSWIACSYVEKEDTFISVSDITNMVLCYCLRAY